MDEEPYILWTHNQFPYSYTMIHCAKIIAGTLVLYDFGLTFSDEVYFIWRSKWSLPKILFLVMRYYTILYIIISFTGVFMKSVTSEFCSLFIWCFGLSLLLQPVFAQGLLQIRIYALYSFSRRVLVFLGIFYLLSNVIIGWSIISEILRIPAGRVVNHLGRRSTCPDHFFFIKNRSLYTVIIPGVVFEFILCTMAVYKGIRSYGGTLFKAPTMRVASILINTIIWDSLMYFVILIAGQILTLSFWAAHFELEHHGYLEFCTVGLIGITCILGCRMVINLRKAAHGRERYHIRQDEEAVDMLIFNAERNSGVDTVVPRAI